ncbi:hypothetical protein HYW21_04890 [Candidatus Woesearchaeota archaeon]|nr:hypothetical protein [Candidatus Woesearchaeota archaeon]
MKKRLTRQEEFEVMKLVLDKFLWIGVLVMLFGAYQMTVGDYSVTKGLSFVVVGAIVLVLMLILIVREYEVIQ